MKRAESTTRRKPRVRMLRPRIESLEGRMLLDGAAGTTPSIVVGRTLSSYTVGGVRDDLQTITYTVYNVENTTETGVVLTTTLAPGVSLASASVPPTRNGQTLTWDLGTLGAFNRASVVLTVKLPATVPVQLDGGARVSALLKGATVTDSAPAATLRPGTVDASLLASTPDANTTDPFIQRKAAELDYDPARIDAYLRTEVGYESYTGSLRGARGTLWSEAGNALDEASLMVALLRASGIPARYARATLPDGIARELILSMFPAPLRVAGLVGAGGVADPANDPTLLAESRDHYWVQYDAGGGAFTDADTTLARLAPGQTLAAAQGTFTEVPDSLRHKTTVTLSAESYSQAAALFGGGGLGAQTVLQHTFNTVDLVGRPITVGNFVNSSAIGVLFSAFTNTYSPYLQIGDAADPNSTHDEVIRGTDYQETLTNFPLGSRVLTGLFLNITLGAPGGSTESHDTTLFDRIGYAARHTGSSVSIAPGADGAPAFTNLDVTTIYVVPGRGNPQFPEQSVADEMAEVQALVAAIPPDNLPDQGMTSLMRAVVDYTRAIANSVVTLSDLKTARIAGDALVKMYYNSPRLVVVSHHLDISSQTPAQPSTFTTDLLRDTIRVLAFPGQSPHAAIVANAIYGISESTAERDASALLFASQPTQVANLAAFDVIRAAVVQDIGLTVVSAANLSTIGSLHISAEARARITAAVLQGNVVVVPTASPTVNGAAAIAWYEINPTTGETSAVAENGTHSHILAWLAVFAVNILNYPVLVTGLLTAAAVFAGAGLIFIYIFTHNSPAPLIVDMQESLADDTTPAEVAGLDALEDHFVARLSHALNVPVSGSTGLPAGSSLFSPAPSDAFGGLTGTGVGVGVIPDPSLAAGLDPGQVATAFRVGIKNLGTTTDTFTLDATNVPAAFAASFSATQVVIPPGETAEIGLYLLPTAGLPAPGTAESFDVTIRSASNAAVTATASARFTVPETHAVTLRSAPPAVNTTPGVATTSQVTLTNAGNVSETVTLATTAAAGLTVSGLASVTLQPGESVVETITFTPDASTPLQSRLAATLTATYGPAGSPQTRSLPITVAVVVPGAAAIADASATVRAVGDEALANRLDDLSSALTDLVRDPANPVFKSQGLAALDSVIRQLGADPATASLADALGVSRQALVAATTPPEVAVAVVALGNVLDGLGATLTSLAAHRFDLSLVVNNQAAQPQSPVSFPVVVRNRGTEATTYDFTVTGLPPGVTASFNVSSLTLAPGAASGGQDVVLTLTSTSTTELPAFSFQVVATVRGAPEVHQSTTGAMTARREVVSIVSVAADPPFVNPGGTVTVSARVLNAVNREQQALASFVVINEAGQTVHASTPAPITLGVVTSLVTLPLGALDTTGLAPGEYTVRVLLTSAGGQPIPGGAGQTTLLVGSPVSATLSAAPTVVPPGTSTVTTTLEINARTSLVNPLALVGQAAVAGATDAVRNGDFVYVASPAGISVFDIAGVNLDNPKLLRVVGSDAYVLRIRGNLLVAVRVGTSSTRLDTYSLADPSSPASLGTTGEIPYGSAADVVVTETHALVSFVNFLFTTPDLDAFAQNGGVLAINIQNPSAPFLDGDAVAQKGTPAGRDGVNDGVLFNDNGTSNDGVGIAVGIDQSGGNRMVWSVAQASPTILLVASTTATGGNTTSGVGVVRVVDISDPRNMKVLRDITIPGTVHAFGIAVEGNRALVTATEGGIAEFTPGFPFLGRTVLASLDLTDPANPSVLATKTLDSSARGITFDAALGNGLYAFGNNGTAGGNPSLFVVDASDPNNLIVNRTDAPASIVTVRGGGGLILSSDRSSLILYQLVASPGIPATAQVRVPKNTGVAVVPGSFSVAPSDVITGTDFDTYVFPVALSASAPSGTITWQSTVSNLPPGATRNLTLDSIVAFTSQGAAGQVTLPGISVAAAPILGLDPTSRIARPGAPAAFTLTLANPTAAAVTYTLSIQGVPPGWSSLPASVTVAAGGSVTRPFTLTAEALAALGDRGFTVNATAGGTTGSASGTLTLAGDPVLPDTSAHGVVVAIIPTQATAGKGTSASFVARVYNTGSDTETFTLGWTLPANVDGSFEQTSLVVPPGAENYRDVRFRLTPRVDAAVGSPSFSITATASGASGTADGVLTIVAGGVRVALDPPTNTPGRPLQLTVTNTGATTDRFDLALAGPGVLAAQLGLTQLTLGPGESRVVPITTGSINFAVPGDLNLTAMATSQTNAAVMDSASSRLTVAAAAGLAARFDPSSKQIDAPGSATFLLRIDNTGNVESRFRVVITGTSGPISARLIGTDGRAVQQLDELALPGLSRGSLVVQVDASALGSGTIQVQIQALDNPGLTATAAATLQVGTSTPPVDATGPVVTAVARYGYHLQPTYLVVVFSEPVNLAQATNLANYRLTPETPNGRRGVRTIPFRSATYDPATNTVILSLQNRLSLWRPYRLSVSGIAGLSGNLLDGDRDGRPGGVYTAPVNRRILAGPARRVPFHPVLSHVAPRAAGHSSGGTTPHLPSRPTGRR